MRKKLIAVILVMTMAAGTVACGKSNTKNTTDTEDATEQNNTQDTASSSETSENDDADDKNATSSDSSNTEKTFSEEYFADGDYKDVSSEDPDATITLSGSTGTISDTTRGSGGSEVTITSKGTYRITGSAEDVTIVVNDDNKSGNIYLVLDNVTMTNTKDACIRIEASDKVVVQCVGENKFTFSDDSEEVAEAAIVAKDDLTINGAGSLLIDSKRHGITCKNDLKITGTTLTLKAEAIGIKSGDSVRIGGGTQTITAAHDGIQVENDTSDSFFVMQDGNLTIDAGYDGIAAGESEESGSFAGFAEFLGGSLTVTAGGGATNSKDSNTSQKGIKCDGDIRFSDTLLAVSSADDAVHSDGNITVSSGELTLATSDDGITAYGTVDITGGTVTVTQSYEGLEANYINISGGDIKLYASDDGINTAGGSDTTQTEMGPWGNASTDAELKISGGTVYVNASGDGLDSNGSLYVSGGTVIVEGPTGNDNGALDIGDSSDCVASITGGVVLAIGSTGMAVNFNDGTQCAGLAALSGAQGTTITVEDGSGFSFTTTKNFECVVYSSPDMAQGNSYTVTTGSASATMDFSSGLYYSNVSGMGGMGGMQGDMPGGMGGQRGR